MKKINFKWLKRKENDKQTAAIKLTLWLIFIAVLFIICKIASIYG